MKHKRPPIPVIIILALVIILAVYFLVTELMDRSDNTLAASGTIEAVSITISPEIGGKVAEVFVDEGDIVSAGDLLFRLDDSLLQAQHAVAQANVDLAIAAQVSAQAARETAQANYDLVVASVHAESASTRSSDWGSEFGSTISQTEELVAARSEVDHALTARDGAQQTLDSLLSETASSDFVAAEERLLAARATFTVSEIVLQRANSSGNSELRSAAQAAFDSASDELETAQTSYDGLKDTDAAQSILQARIDLTVTQERYDASLDRLLTLETGDHSLRITVASAALRQAEAVASQGEAAISQAEASLALIDVQVSKLFITSPVDGVVQVRAVHPGEVIPAGSSAMKLIRLDDLTITVFIPEDRYGVLSLGQIATVSVDSFPGEEFTARITFISDEAEFTPRNVQTVEGRSSTVYAIRLQVEDPDGKLKPGMPADVTFSEE